MVQWLRLHAPNAGDVGSILGQGTEITYAAIKSLHTAAKGPDDSAKIPCAGIAKEIKKIFKNRRDSLGSHGDCLILALMPLTLLPQSTIHTAFLLQALPGAGDSQFSRPSLVFFTALSSLSTTSE